MRFFFYWPVWMYSPACCCWLLWYLMREDRHPIGNWNGADSAVTHRSMAERKWINLSTAIRNSGALHFACYAKYHLTIAQLRPRWGPVLCAARHIIRWHRTPAWRTKYQQIAGHAMLQHESLQRRLPYQRGKINNGSDCPHKFHTWLYISVVLLRIMCWSNGTLTMYHKSDFNRTIQLSHSVHVCQPSSHVPWSGRTIVLLTWDKANSLKQWRQICQQQKGINSVECI